MRNADMAAMEVVLEESATTRSAYDQFVV